MTEDLEVMEKVMEMLIGAVGKPGKLAICICALHASV